jgi:hypothetical protein
VPGTNKAYDRVVGVLDEIEKALMDHLIQQKEEMGWRIELSVKYVHKEPKDLFLIEIPKRLLIGKHVPANYCIVSETKVSVTQFFLTPDFLLLTFFHSFFFLFFFFFILLYSHRILRDFITQPSQSCYRNLLRLKKS